MGFSRPVSLLGPSRLYRCTGLFWTNRQLTHSGLFQWEVETTKNGPLTDCYHFATQLMNTGQDGVVSAHSARSGKPNKIIRKGLKANYGVQALANSKPGGRRFAPCHSCQL